MAEDTTPNHNSELDRLDLTDEIQRMALGNKRFLAPMDEKPSRILSVGPGHEISAIEMADEYQTVQTVGMDLGQRSPLGGTNASLRLHHGTEANRVHANVNFEVDGAEKTLELRIQIWLSPSPATSSGDGRMAQGSCDNLSMQLSRDDGPNCRILTSPSIPKMNC